MYEATDGSVKRRYMQNMHSALSFHADPNTEDEQEEGDGEQGEQPPAAGGWYVGGD